jgi:hypothetical protein
LTQKSEADAPFNHPCFSPHSLLLKIFIDNGNKLRKFHEMFEAKGNEREIFYVLTAGAVCRCFRDNRVKNRQKKGERMDSKQVVQMKVFNGTIDVFYAKNG